MSAGPTEQFGRLPYRVVEAKGLAKLDRNELAAYAVIVAHASGDDWAAHPSIDRIAELGGMCARTVTRVVVRLARKGLIRITAGGGRGRANSYAVTRNPDTLSVTLSANGNPDKSAPKPCQSDAETLTDRTPNPDSKVSPQQRNRKNTATDSGPAAAADAGAHGNREERETTANMDSAVVATLKIAGIGEPTRSELASLRGITAALVSEVADATKRGGGQTGALVLNIRAKVEAQAERAVESQRSREARARARRESENRKAAEERRARKLEARIDALSDGEFARLSAGLPDWITKIVGDKNPRESTLVRSRVAAALAAAPDADSRGDDARERTLGDEVPQPRRPDCDSSDAALTSRLP